MKIYLIVAIILFNLLALNYALAKDNSKETDFQSHYVPKGMNKEFKIPLDSYLNLLANRSGYEYIPPESVTDCLSLSISMPRGYEKKTVFEHLNHIAFSDFHHDFEIAIDGKDTSIKLICRDKKAK